MSGWGVYDVIIEIILNIFQGFMVTWYLQKCLGTDREKKDVYITGTVYTFLYLMLQGYFTDFEGVGILIYLGLSLFFSYMMLGGTFIKKLVYNIMLVFVLAFSSVIAGNIVGLVLSKDFMELIKTRNIDYYIAAFVNQIVLMSFLLIIVKMEERTRSFLKDRYIILTLSIPIITIMVCAGVLSIDADNGNNIVYTSVVIIGLVAINIITIILLMMEQNICQKQAENAIQMEMLEHQKQNVDEINKVYLETKKVRHEITKVIDMTQYLIENGQQERAVNYLSEFQKEGKLYRQDNIYSENAIINHILNRKIEYCNNNGLSIKCMVCGELKGVSDYDIHIILENLLDNAIEAALKAVNKRISVDIYSDEQAMVIKISNTTEENVLKNNLEMNTTKKDNSYHGYGIKNVSELVKKNNGTIEYIQLGVDIVQCRVLLML